MNCYEVAFIGAKPLASEIEEVMALTYTDKHLNSTVEHLFLDGLKKAYPSN